MNKLNLVTHTYFSDNQPTRFLTFATHYIPCIILKMLYPQHSIVDMPKEDRAFFIENELNMAFVESDKVFVSFLDNLDFKGNKTIIEIKDQGNFQYEIKTDNNFMGHCLQHFIIKKFGGKTFINNVLLYDKEVFSEKKYDNIDYVIKLLDENPWERFVIKNAVENVPLDKKEEERYKRYSEFLMEEG